MSGELPLIPPGVRESRTGVFGSGIVPIVWCSIGTSISRAAICGSAAASAIEFSGPQGISYRSRRSTQPAVVSFAKPAISSGSSAAWLRERACAAAKRSSSISSGRSSSAQKSAHWFGTAQASAITMCPSCVGKAWNGTAEGWRVPSGRGSSPVTW